MRADRLSRILGGVHSWRRVHSSNRGNLGIMASHFWEHSRLRRGVVLASSDVYLHTKEHLLVHP
jgi:hypothetical protein